MGGQACILYGAAEFSRDVDLAILADEQNLKRLESALAELRAEPVTFLPWGSMSYGVAMLDYHNRPRRPPRTQIALWLREARTASLLLELCHHYPTFARSLAKSRGAVYWGLRDNLPKLQAALAAEEKVLGAKDRAYWQPLRQELSQWRQRRTRKSKRQ